MDNASKALIMAGAILISIAIVGVGVFIFSSTSSITSSGQQQIDAAAAQTANSTIRQYTGNRVRGSTVKEFVEYVATLNANQTFPNDLIVNITEKLENGSDSVEDLDQDYVETSAYRNALLNAITPNAFYTVEAEDTLPGTTKDGYYDLIKISAN